MRGPLRDLASATGFLTRIPVGTEIVDGELPDVVGWYPAVGLLLGAAAYLPLSAWSTLAEPSLPKAALGAAILIGWWAWLTRMLHWDGLADTADALWGAYEPARRLEIMKDSRVGAFGATALVLVGLVQTAALTVLISSGILWPLLLAPMTARAGAMMACWTLPPARSGGLGFSAAGEPTGGARAVSIAVMLIGLGAVLLAACREGAGWIGVLTVLVSGDLIALWLPRSLSRPVGGLTGDILGATVLLVETGLLSIAALVL